MTNADRAGDWGAPVSARSDPRSKSIDVARAHEPGRGREAAKPDEIPPRGWKDILWRVVFSVGSDRVFSTAGGVAFFALLAIFPALGTVVSLYGLFADPSTIGKHLALASGFLPGGVLSLMTDEIIRITHQSNGRLGV